MNDHIATGFIREITPRNLLSFGPDQKPIELRPLNVLIGPNASGKSNLIEAINLMRNAPRDLQEVTRKGGGVQEWICKFSRENSASVELVLDQATALLRHALVFSSRGQSFVVVDETIKDDKPPSPFDYLGLPVLQTHYGYANDRPVLRVEGGQLRALEMDEVNQGQSILAQRRDPDSYPKLAWLASSYSRIRVYREWPFGRNSIFRTPQPADNRNDVLEEDFSNLGLYLNRLKTRFPAVHQEILAGLRDLYDGFTDYNVLVEGGSVQVFFTELTASFPATRLSDGTLRYLCLLAILCNPEPPPVICIEEPELGLHPDLIPNLAQLMRKASLQSQLIVATHSDILVDALSDTPESVLVCSKTNGLTEMRRLSADALSEWLKKYKLGQLWTMGEIGGTRW
ncbi:MAG: AAA family ATPase [Acidobacteria bacterium]|nr:AAA family ATPase [Acidobacteriota bacterium]